MKNNNNSSWSIGTVEGRWSGFGPYYAMFPVLFARQMIEQYSQPGDTIIDPFCGRGTTNFVAKVLGRDSYGYEINPVGWIFSVTKTSPAKQLNRILDRVEEIGKLREKVDYIPENEFQYWAWSEEVLSFINSARRNLDWRLSKVDRTIAAVLLVYLHAKIGGGLSNQMRQSKSLSPDYSVNWWKNRDMFPPKVNPVEFIKSRIQWRYAKGIIDNNSKAIIENIDSRKGLLKYHGPPPSLILTSPPYYGVTNYEYDNWIRLWALGGSSLPNYSNTHRHQNKEKYFILINDVFNKLSEISSSHTKVVVRTDFRKYTFDTTLQEIHEAWPNHKIYSRHTCANKPTQTALFGDKSNKPGEVDLIALPENYPPPTDSIKTD